MGASAHVHVVWPHRLLRQLAEPARHRPLPDRAPPDHPVLRARRGVVVVLPRRGRLRSHRRAVVRTPMSKGPVTTLVDREAGDWRLAGSAVLLGRARIGDGVVIAEGAVIRSTGHGVAIGTG